MLADHILSIALDQEIFQRIIPRYHSKISFMLGDCVPVRAVEKKKGATCQPRKLVAQHGIFLFASISLMPVESYASLSHFCILANMYLSSFHIISAPSFALQNTQTCVQHHSTMLLTHSVCLRQSCERSCIHIHEQCWPLCPIAPAVTFRMFSVSSFSCGMSV